jgi:hypothetical protein
MSFSRSQQVASLALSALLLAFLSGCSSNTASEALPTINLQNPPTGANVLSISVNPGPTEAAGDGAYTNGAFASVTICVPGNPNQCQTIGGILVDTGSSGLRILSSALTLSLPSVTDTSGNPIGECADFASGVTWGAVQTATVTVSGETTNGAVPIQVIGSATPDEPSDCAAENVTVDTLDTLGANGLLGIGPSQQDCGSSCAPPTTNSTPEVYYSCPSATDCNVTSLAVGDQVANPIIDFPTDNNGSIIELPSIPVASAEGTANGVVVFGINTEPNNALGSATVYGIDPSTDNFTTIFDETAFTDEAFIDLGSNALYFNPVSSGLAGTECEDFTFWFCPDENVALTAVNEGIGDSNNTGTVNFTVGNADLLLDNNPDAAVASGLAGPADVFDWGLPFFYGINVYTAIDGQGLPGAPYWAY